MPKLLVERRGPATVLTIDRPEVHNCIDGETAVAIARAVTGFTDDPDARVLIVTGAGTASFSSGADLKHAHELWAHGSFQEAGPLGFARLDPGKPTIAAVNGYCFAGGMELAAWCDFRVAAANAEFGVLNRRWGVPFVDGGTQHTQRGCRQALGGARVNRCPHVQNAVAGPANRRKICGKGVDPLRR